MNDGLIDLNYSAFRWCFSLHDIRIPGTVEEIGGYFPYNNSFRNIYFLGEKTDIKEENISDISSLWRGITLHVLPGSNAERFAKNNNLKFEYITE